MLRICGIAALGACAALVGIESAGGAFPGTNGRIVFARGSVIETINPDGTGLTTVIEGASAPAWSPDGTRLAYSRGCRIYVAAQDGSGPRVVTTGRQCAREPAWSPQGDRLVFTRRLAARGGIEATALFVVSADGGTARRLTQRTLTARRLKNRRNWADDDGPVWSTGDLIAFSRSTATQNGQLHLVRSDGGGLRRLTRASSSVSHVDPSWSPDGRTIAFAKRGGGLAPGSDVFLVEADGAGERPLSSTVGGFTYTPAWSPDGAFVCIYVGTHEAHSNVLAIVARDGSLVRVLSAGRGNAPDWQPLRTSSS